MASKILTAADILSADDIERELVEIPEWGGSVWVYGMTASERDRQELEAARILQNANDRSAKKAQRANIRAMVAAIVCRDENGARIFGSEHIQQLGKRSAKPLDRIYDVARRLSGITDSTDEEEEKENLSNGQR